MILGAIEAILYLAFIADCLLLVAGMGGNPQYYPEGGASLIVILLIIAGLQRLRGHRFD